jgi:hypothetical protein
VGIRIFIGHAVVQLVKQSCCSVSTVCQAASEAGGSIGIAVLTLDAPFDRLCKDGFVTGPLWWFRLWFQDRSALNQSELFCSLAIDCAGSPEAAQSAENVAVVRECHACVCVLFNVGAATTVPQVHLALPSGSEGHVHWCEHGVLREERVGRCWKRDCHCLARFAPLL